MSVLSFFRRGPRAATSKRVLVPFTGGELDPTVLDAAIRIARAEDATLVPAYLMVTPFEYGLEAPLQREVAVAMPLLEAVEHAALRAGLPVDARVETGRTPTHALRRLWDAERFDRIVAPAPPGRGQGFTPKELQWILVHAPAETLILRPAPLNGRPAAVAEEEVA
ncbi:MAG TPA: universal stress protein [Gaiellaceae bacterium]|nr:universal stress protein [Gaiellaceae bacterium]